MSGRDTVDQAEILPATETTVTDTIREAMMDPQHPTPDAGQAPEPALLVKGNLDAEETAALTAVIHAVAAQAEQHRREGAGRTDRDRTLDRRRRLGLWARPGSGSWKHAAGQR
ncbi:acyl-CoA carboxylase subunit epsilon [Citricoccus sp. NPDC079358]|uniref:acyl-CoA carboxylase subunit epsilon n=1 Tax=Citricoccus sp. NPDC079358 TaxID=3154653 RepID=UPI00344FD19D